jgi:hypothetical protein
MLQTATCNIGSKVKAQEKPRTRIVTIINCHWTEERSCVLYVLFCESMCMLGWSSCLTAREILPQLNVGGHMLYALLGVRASSRDAKGEGESEPFARDDSQAFRWGFLPWILILKYMRCNYLRNYEAKSYIWCI